MTAVLVTGASGFIGRAVCRRLLRENRHVIGTIRRAEAAADLPKGVEPRLVPNVADYVDWSGHLRDVSAVVHLVARTRATGEFGTSRLTEYRRLNVAATRQLAQAARASHVRRFVYLSSLQVVGPGSVDAYTERTPCAPSTSFGRTKLEAEQALFEDARGTTLEPIVLRPPLVYGVHVHGEFRCLLDSLTQGKPLPLARRSSVRSLIHIDNLADAVAHVLRHRDAAGHVYHVADAEALSTRELIVRLCRHLDVAPRMFFCPSLLLRLASRLSGRARLIAELSSSLKSDARTIREVLGWHPPVTCEDGLRATCEWYRERRRGGDGIPSTSTEIEAPSEPLRHAA